VSYLTSGQSRSRSYIANRRGYAKEEDWDSKVVYQRITVSGKGQFYYRVDLGFTTPPPAPWILTLPPLIPRRAYATAIGVFVRRRLDNA